MAHEVEELLKDIMGRAKGGTKVSMCCSLNLLRSLLTLIPAQEKEGEAEWKMMKDRNRILLGTCFMLLLTELTLILSIRCLVLRDGAMLDFLCIHPVTPGAHHSFLFTSVSCLDSSRCLDRKALVEIINSRYCIARTLLNQVHQTPRL